MVVGTVSSAGLPPGWQEVHAEGQVYYWCVCLFFFFFFFPFRARAPTFFFSRIGLLFVLSLFRFAEPFREENTRRRFRALFILSSFGSGCSISLHSDETRESWLTLFLRALLLIFQEHGDERDDVRSTDGGIRRRHESTRYELFRNEWCAFRSVWRG